MDSLDNLQNGEILTRNKNLECLEALEYLESTEKTKLRAASDYSQCRISRNPIKRVELEESIKYSIQSRESRQFNSSGI